MLVCELLPSRKRHAGPRVREAPGLPCALRFREGNRRCKARAKDVARSRTHIHLSSPATGSRECAPDNRLRRVPSIPETSMVKPRSRGVLDPRLRGDDVASNTVSAAQVDKSNEKAGSYTTKSRSSIPDQSAVAIRRSGIEMTKSHSDDFCRQARYCSADDLFSTHEEHPFGFDWESRPKISVRGGEEKAWVNFWARLPSL